MIVTIQFDNVHFYQPSATSFSEASAPADATTAGGGFHRSVDRRQATTGSGNDNGGWMGRPKRWLELANGCW